jgi:5-formyltetrahydrofolate cyclo-ligase
VTSLPAKQTVRDQLLRRRASLPESALTSAATVVGEVLAAWVGRHPSPLVAAYVPVGSEPGGLLPAVLEAAGARVLLPVVLPSFDLDWAAYAGRDSLVAARRGLLEPAGSRLGPSAVTGCDLVVVPALAVDGSGNRLGRGAGCYDRALGLLPPGVPIVALLHDGEVLPSVPAEPHDVPVTAAVTPRLGWCDVPFIPTQPPPLDDSPIIEHT